ncbi:MAG TPA: hypothetical protein VFW45_05980, partial [Candidatus Polarisedimenticolia bacterium]|nr:hypothetical protein [Candidatus Polarisedimenticolia bacterium]
MAYGTFGPGVAAGGAFLSIDDDGQVAAVPFTIHGGGFGAGESVRLTVTHADGTAEAGMGHGTWTVTAPNGTFSATWSIKPSDIESDRFLVRAEGSQSGSTAIAAFGRMAFVMTDLFDYEPGASAGIRGAGFRAGEEVTLQVIHTRGGTDGGAGHQPWTVVADAQGNITSSWYVDPDDSLGAEFLLHAVGTDSHLAATWAFMDAVCLNPPPADPVAPLPMSGVGCPANLNSCTSNDVVTTVVAATPVDGDVCGSATDTVTLDFTVRFETTANQRYDLGFFIANDGLSLPDHTALACAGSAPQVGAGDGNADPLDCDSDKFLNLDPIGHKIGNPDTCGDLQNNAGPVFITFRATVGCNRFDADHNLLISSCSVWEQNANHDTACTTLAQAGSGSKCDCTDLSFAGLLDPCVTGFCDDDNACTADDCDSSGGEATCHNVPVEEGSACDDGTLCTDSDQCRLGVCTGTPVGCDDGNGCTHDFCDPATGCSHTNNADSCDDNVFCNGAGSCSDGSCSSPGDPCPAQGKVCDEVNDRCSECIADENCSGPGAPVCHPETGVCVGCNVTSDCQDPSHPFCDAGTNTCVECLTNAECVNGNFCDGSEVCTSGVCSSPGDPCPAQGKVCDETHDRCSECIADENCS